MGLKNYFLDRNLLSNSFFIQFHKLLNQADYITWVTNTVINAVPPFNLNLNHLKSFRKKDKQPPLLPYIMHLYILVLGIT